MNFLYLDFKLYAVLVSIIYINKKVEEVKGIMLGEQPCPKLKPLIIYRIVGHHVR